MQPIRQRTSRAEEWARRRAITGMIVVSTLAAALGVAGFLAAGSRAGSATRTNATVSLRQTKLGTILVDPRGHTIYLFTKDRNGKSTCSSNCAMFWPPLITAGKPTAGAGVKASLLGTTRRSNGKLQVTYNKHPLYTFLLDRRASQTRGEGNLAFGARWYAVSARGTAVIKAVLTTTTSTTTTSTTTTTYCAYPPC